jgi:hypothetical protein
MHIKHFNNAFGFDSLIGSIESSPLLPAREKINRSVDAREIAAMKSPPPYFRCDDAVLERRLFLFHGGVHVRA